MSSLWTFSYIRLTLQLITCKLRSPLLFQAVWSAVACFLAWLIYKCTPSYVPTDAQLNSYLGSLPASSTSPPHSCPWNHVRSCCSALDHCLSSAAMWILHTYEWDRAILEYRVREELLPHYAFKDLNNLHVGHTVVDVQLTLQSITCKLHSPFLFQAVDQLSLCSWLDSSLNVLLHMSPQMLDWIHIWALCLRPPPVHPIPVHEIMCVVAAVLWIVIHH